MKRLLVVLLAASLLLPACSLWPGGSEDAVPLDPEAEQERRASDCRAAWQRAETLSARLEALPDTGHDDIADVLHPWWQSVEDASVAVEDWSEELTNAATVVLWLRDEVEDWNETLEEAEAIWSEQAGSVDEDRLWEDMADASLVKMLFLIELRKAQAANSKVVDVPIPSVVREATEEAADALDDAESACTLMVEARESDEAPVSLDSKPARHQPAHI